MVANFPGKITKVFEGKICVNFLTQKKSKIYGIRRSFSSRASNLLKGVRQGLSRMEHKVFLTKYRVAADEIALSGPEPIGDAPVIEQSATALVYRGEEIESGRDVAIEVIPAASFESDVRDELEAEALAAKKINHINIPALYDFGIEDDHLIYVTEYVDGTSAEEWVNDHGPMPTGAALRIALQVVSAMGASAFHRIAHHAINPRNLILVPGQTPEGDWPLVKVLHFVGPEPTFSSESTSVASFDKSSHYASPEQLRQGTVDFRSEIYSLGATIWFLLTGAPPLMAPAGPLAMQPTTNGLAVDKLNGMPKRIRRLLGQMLSVKPEDRPQDALAFYRQIQGCLAKVDRRESLARRFGIPIFSRSNVVAVPGRRRFPAKALALAAVLLGIAALAALLLPGYLRQQRIRHAEEPIGVPIGVPDTTAPAPPVIANTTSAPASTQAPAETSVASTNTTQNPPPRTEEQNAPPARAPESTPVTAANEVAAAPIKPLPTAPPENVEREESPKVAANDAAPPQQEATEPKREKPVPAQKQEVQSNRETEVAASIPTARPVTPEVRRAEPAPPAEGPEEEVAATTEPKAVPPPSRTKKERVAKTKRDSERDVMRQTRVVDEDEETAAAPMPKLPRGRIRAKFIGVAADGNWMFELPSKKIVIVPAPPGG
jgi:serine/threonine protein kinase